MKDWRVTLRYHGSPDFRTTETAHTRASAILDAQRYARACGWPANYASATATESTAPKRIEDDAHA